MIEKPNDIMVRIIVTLTRGGSLDTRIEYPSGPVAVPEAIQLGMLDVAQHATRATILKGETP